MCVCGGSFTVKYINIIIFNIHTTVTPHDDDNNNQQWLQGQFEQKFQKWVVVFFFEIVMRENKIQME